MRVFESEFFRGLNVDRSHYSKVFKKLGVKNRFIYDREDLETIRDKLPPSRYKSVLLIDRAFNLLENSND